MEYSDKLYGYEIIVYNGLYPNSGILERYNWDGFYHQQLIKQLWYFEYRYALLKIKYPRKGILNRSYSYEITPDKELILLNHKIKAKKGKITEISNKIKLAEKNWNCLFPIQDDVLYIQANNKLTKLKEELEALLNKKIKTI